METLGLFSLNYRRLRGDLIYARRILRGELGVELSNFFQRNADETRRGHVWKLFKPRRLRITAVATLSTRVANHWNALPAEIAESESEESFKRMVDELFSGNQAIFACEFN